MTTTTEGRYREELLVALRVRDVPGDRIGDVLAEVEAHTAETGEDPRDAFGPPKEYARTVATAMGYRHGVWHLDRRTVVVSLLIAVLSGMTTALLIGGVLGLAGDPDASRWGTSPLANTLLGAVLAAVTIAVLTLGTWHRTTPVRDPRTGANLSRSSRWVVPAVFAALFTLTAVGVLAVELLAR